MRLQATGYRLRAAGYRLQAAGHGLQVGVGVLLLFCVTLLSGSAAAEVADATPSATAAVESASRNPRLLAVEASLRARVHGASQERTAEAPPLAGPRSLGGLLFQIILSLGVTLLLLYGAMRLLRRHLSTAGRDAPDRVRVVSKTPLSSRSHLYVIEVAGRTLLVGEGPNGLALIRDLGETREEPVAAEHGEHALDEAFADRSLGESPLSFSKELKECLRFLRSPLRRPEK